MSKTKEDFIKEFDNMDLTIISKIESITNKFKVSCTDIEGYKYFCNIDNVRNGSLSKFHSKNPYSIFNINNYFCKIGSKLYTDEKEYINKSIYIHFKCKECNHEFSNSRANIFKKNGRCPNCDIQPTGSFYNITLAEREKEKLSKIGAIVYIIKVFNESESFFKIGITEHNLKTRFPKYEMPYNYEKIFIIDNINKYQAIYIEEYLKYLNKKYEYEPNLKFNGKTECFRDLVDIDYSKVKEEMYEEVIIKKNEEEEKLIDMFLNGKSMSNISKLSGISTTQVCRILSRKYGYSQGVRIIFPDNKFGIYKSVRECAKELNISINTILKAINSKAIFENKRNRESLDKIKGCLIQYVYLKNGEVVKISNVIGNR